MVAGTFVYQFEEARYKDITDGLRTQNGTQAATIKNEDATITQLREQLKGTSPELAAIQANRDKISRRVAEFLRARWRAFPAQGFRRAVVEQVVERCEFLGKRNGHVDHGKHGAGRRREVRGSGQ